MLTSIDGFNLRLATNADCPAVQALIFGVLKEYGLQPAPTTTDQDLFDLEAFYGNPKGFFAVVLDQASIVATLGLLKLDAETCELRKMYTLPSVRGRGLGRALLDFACDTARAWGCRRMVLETASVLTEAVHLYQRYGFRQYHPPAITCRCDLAMEYKL